ncbi:MAG: hypothetical protein QOG63_1776 [Thermoleophilaceae bacterium]|jgi:hypothetical protein|nr:hypothetical protein [Thermoleophilaceae bacterium]
MFRTLVSGAAVALVVVAAAPSAAQAANSCRTASTAPGNHVVIASKGAVVFSSRKLKQDVACSYRYRRAVKLGRIACCSQVRYTLGGRYLAYAVRLDQAFHEVDEIGAVDLKTGKVPKYGGAQAIDTNGYLDSFYVTPAGTLAWLQYGVDDNGRRIDLTVRAAARGGKVKDLDSGKIARGSLAIGAGGGTLYWTNDGTPRTAALR